MDVETDGLRCERQAEYGYDTVQVDFPAVISVGDAINEPRYPSLKAIMGAKKKQLDTRGHRRRRASRPTGSARPGRRSCAATSTLRPPSRAGTIIEDEDTNETVEKIIAWLDERKLI